MHVEELREYALLKADVAESFPFGNETLVFKTNDKIFLLLPLDAEELSFNVKCDPEWAIALREQYPSIRPGFHMNKKHWNTVVVDGSVSNKLLKEMIDHSYDLVKKKKK